MKICYTAIIGPYDQLFDPLWNDSSWTFICFTDQDIRSDIWNIVRVNSQEDKVKQARSIKIFPDFVRNTDKNIQYLWVDANIQIRSNLNAFIHSLRNEDLCVMNHPHRNNLFDEVEAIIKYKKDDEKIVKKQLLTYQLEGYACKELAATGVLFRKNTDSVLQQSKIWKNEVHLHSKRDQMSFNYSCWKSRIRPYYFQYEEIKNRTFIYHKHLHKK